MLVRSRPRLGITVGIPLSGKSVFCKRMMESGWTVLNPDTFRQVYSGTPNTLLDSHGERGVWDCIFLTAKSLLTYGHNVLIDATNCNRWSRSSWKNVADDYGIELEIYLLPFDIDTSINRNILIGRFKDENGNPSSEVIYKFANNYVPPTSEEGEIILCEE